jgi:dCMP deaminase
MRGKCEYGPYEAAPRSCPVCKFGPCQRSKAASPFPPKPAASPVGWPVYLYGFAAHAAVKSKDSTQVGAALVGPENEVRLTGYNGPPKGVSDLPGRRERPIKYLYAAHAEANLVAFAAREGIRTKGCRVFVTHRCCAACARTLIQAGVVGVFYGPGQTSMDPDEFIAADLMFREAGVEYRPVEGL